MYESVAVPPCRTDKSDFPSTSYMMKITRQCPGDRSAGPAKSGSPDVSVGRVTVAVMDRGGETQHRQRDGRVGAVEAERAAADQLNGC